MGYLTPINMLASVMYVLRQISRLEAAKVLPRPRLDALMPRLGLASASWSLPRPCLSLVSSALPRLEASEPLNYVTIS